MPSTPAYIVHVLALCFGTTSMAFYIVFFPIEREFFFFLNCVHSFQAEWTTDGLVSGMDLIERLKYLFPGYDYVLQNLIPPDGRV